MNKWCETSRVAIYAHNKGVFMAKDLRSLVPIMDSPVAQMLMIACALRLELARATKSASRRVTPDENSQLVKIPAGTKAYVDRFVKKLVEQCFVDAQAILEAETSGESGGLLRFGGVVCLVPSEDLCWESTKNQFVLRSGYWAPRSGTTAHKVLLLLNAQGFKVSFRAKDNDRNLPESFELYAFVD